MRLALVAPLLALVGCSRASGDSEIAVRRDGVDCTLIAQTLTSLELGNYADPDVRAPREAVIASRCRDAQLTAADASCLLGATKESLPYCREPLTVEHREVPKVSIDASGLPPSCGAYVRDLERFAMCPKLPADARKAVKDAADQAVFAWRQMAQQQNQYTTQTLEDACRSGIQALLQGMQAMGCQ